MGSLTLHHLVHSRSDRILWLLEELELPYALEAYPRNEINRAPEALARVHPLGKAPTLEDDGEIIMESGAIVEYVLARYGGGRLRPEVDSPNFASYLEWMHFAEGTAMAQFLMALFLTGEIAPGLEPHPLAHAATAEVERILDHVEARLESSDYLAGPNFSAADIMMGWVLFMLELRKRLDRRERTKRYLRRLETRPGYQRMNAKR